MKTTFFTALTVAAVLVAFTSGCAQEISHSESSQPGWFGGRTTKESTTIRNADGSISTESSSKTTH
jgi:hypothetical protein